MLIQFRFLIFFFLILMAAYSRQKKKQLIANGDIAADEDKLQEEVSLSVTPKLVGVFVFCMCGMLLLLYFFFSYLGK